MAGLGLCVLGALVMLDPAPAQQPATPAKATPSLNPNPNPSSNPGPGPNGTPALPEPGPMANTADPIPPGWTGPVFQLSDDYPAQPPPAEVYPWKSIDFRTDPEAYIRSVIAYCWDGNLDVGFVVQNNPVRKWYHAPGLASNKNPNGREFIHGLTKERTSLPGELDPLQKTRWDNWAVGFYNPAGGYIIGQVWANPGSPRPDLGRFPDGTVAFKLLFTTATVAEVPFLSGSPEWTANVTQLDTDPAQAPARPPAPGGCRRSRHPQRRPDRLGFRHVRLPERRPRAQPLEARSTRRPDVGQ